MNLEYNDINIICNEIDLLRKNDLPAIAKENPFYYENITLLNIKELSGKVNGIELTDIQIDYTVGDDKIVKKWNMIYSIEKVVNLKKPYFELKYNKYKDQAEYFPFDLIKYIPYSKEIKGINLDIRLLSQEDEIDAYEDEYIKQKIEDFKYKHPILTFFNKNKYDEFKPNIKEGKLLLDNRITVLNINDNKKDFLSADILFKENDNIQNNSIVRHGGWKYTTQQQADIDNEYFGVVLDKENHKINYVKFMPYKS